MSGYATNEQKVVEELYLALQLVIVLILLNTAFPLFSKVTTSHMMVFAIVYIIYFLGKSGTYVYFVMIKNKSVKTYPNLLLTTVDGLFLSWLIYLEWHQGNNIMSLFYIYMLIQGIRYQGKKPWIFALLPIVVHLTMVSTYMQGPVYKLEHLVDMLTYVFIAFFIEIPFKQISETHKEKQHYFEELKKKNIELKKMATTDYLTALSNHQSFYTYFDELKHHAVRENFPISLVLIDIDNFKRINDTYGHLSGDQILKELADILKRCIRSQDFAARYGGEEFAVILPYTTLERSVQIAERIRFEISKCPFDIGDEVINVTVSIGTDTFEPDHSYDGLLEFINSVDELLYKAKKSGKNQVQYISKVA